VPHVPLTGDGNQISTLDVAAPGFAVLADHGHDLWRRAAAEAGDSLGVAVAVRPAGSPLCWPACCRAAAPDLAGRPARDYAA